MERSEATASTSGHDEPTGTARPAPATTPAQRERRQRIVRAAQELLVRHPYDQIQIRDVAERADVALGTLYRYFPSKEQLFAHVLLDWSASFDEALRRRRPDRDTDAERLRLALRRAVGAFERFPNFFQLISVLEVSKDAEVLATFSEYSSRFGAALIDALADTNADDAEVVISIAMSLLGTLLRGWSLGHLSMRAVNARVDRAVDILFAGVRQR